MLTSKHQIALSVPDQDKPERTFSFSLKQDLRNQPCEYSKPSRILALSDIEGNFQSFRKLLYKYKVIDKHYKWIFKDGHLVIAGDCFDRGEQVMECLWLIYSLEEKAQRNGGYVHFILGNHEIMNLTGDWRYVHPKYAQRENGSSTALYDGNNELWRWLCTKNIIEKIGDILFVHGGIAKELLKPGIFTAEINKIARPYYTRAEEKFTDPLLSLIYGTETSPFWYRGYYLGTASQEQVDATLKHFNVKTIVTGHTIIGSVESFFDGKVINIDNDHTTDSSEALLISHDKFYRISGKKKERIK